MTKDYLPIMLKKLLPPVCIYTRPSETVFAKDAEGQKLRVNHGGRSYCHKDIWNGTYSQNCVFEHRSVKMLTRSLLEDGEWKTYEPNSHDEDVNTMCDNIDCTEEDDSLA